MTEIWIWSVWERVLATAPVPDLAGYSVEAADGHIGEIDDVSFDAGSGSIIVDTGFWIFGKKRMVPAGMIDAIDDESRTVSLSCSKADVKAAPDYDPDRRRSRPSRRSRRPLPRFAKRPGRPEPATASRPTDQGRVTA